MSASSYLSPYFLFLSPLSLLSSPFQNPISQLFDRPPFSPQGTPPVASGLSTTAWAYQASPSWTWTTTVPQAPRPFLWPASWCREASEAGRHLVLWLKPQRLFFSFFWSVHCLLVLGLQTLIIKLPPALLGLVECALALGFEKMERGSLTSKVPNRTSASSKHVYTSFYK